MGLLAAFDIHCDALPLVGVARAAPEATILLELQFNHGDRPLFMITVTGGSQTAVEAALTDAVDVEEWALIGEADSTRRYQAVPALSLAEQLGDYIDDLAGLEALATVDAAIERIEVNRDGWRQSGWFADRAAFTEFSTFWQRNAGFRLRRLTRDGASEPPGDGLSDRQREALRTAYEMGYFDIPRRTSLNAIAAELDISASSVSERLRRAHLQLIEETVATTWPPLPD
ncbi:helix-turn-helix domain-containing protein [Natrinema salaciae]|uniref:HTH DNA binding domain-containing protein n=1 Tax=Natrinema salaciae TaxID=1186196 RepID=A0A1H9S4A5_9EURY|nr:helix-turn-helix domain-containing protein [Natrinema salaciae]SER79465.1 HTH DNA binding domain-containing protein [Natrinema salaciae]